jgi:CRISPR-associated protein Csd2
MSSLTKRYDFVLLFDVQDGNPNGDPDAGNLPRIDAETGMGLVTDVCLKRKVRNYVQLSGKDIFIKEKAVLNTLIDNAYEALKIDLTTEPADPKDGKKRNKDGTAQGGEVDKGRDFMCSKYYDIRTFGAVMSTGANAGQVRGPVQLTFARSVEPIVALEHSITVCAARKEDKPIEEQIGIQGRKYTVPYGLYRAHGFVSAHLAKQTGFSEEDLTLFWNALKNLFEHDRSAARGMMATRGLYVFEHNTALGNAPAHKLFERIVVQRKDGSTGPARSFNDYVVKVDCGDGPEGGITLLPMIG